ncbi:MAG: hypothetical protein SWH78_15415 [Thermodesulfobacteriota bacterium]|nr:hypothetical protein [Thermodesulfobacteriota bacterium]
MAWTSLISQLFEASEGLLATRDNLQALVARTTDQDDRLRLSLVMREIDVIRLTLLYEYELLDTSHIVQEAFIHLYYARRLEILQLSREQIRGHCDGLDGRVSGMKDEEALREITHAREIVQASLRCMDDIIRALGQDIVVEGKQQTRH